MLQSKMIHHHKKVICRPDVCRPEVTNKSIHSLSFVHHDQEEAIVVCGLRISPRRIVFTKSLSGEPIETKVYFQNTSSKIVRFKISRPYSCAFLVKDSGSTNQLGPGMKTIREITFSNNDNTVSDSSVPMKINDVNFRLPIVVQRMKSNLIITPHMLDFGVINVGSQLALRTLHIRNIGDCTGKFAIDIGGSDIMLTADPRSGRIKPGHSVDVAIRAAGITAGDFDNEFWITSDTSTRILTSVTAILPTLKVGHLKQSGEFTIIDFKHIYFNTCMYETFLVHNYSAVTTTFVVLVEYKKLFQSLGLIHNMTKDYDWVMINPEEGKLSPFEARIFTARFYPIMSTNKAKEQEFWTILKVVRVDVKDIKLVESEKKSLELELANMAFNKAQLIQNLSEISICVYGKAEEADIIFEPNEIYISLEVESQCRKSFKIINGSKNLPIDYEYVKFPNVDVLPPTQTIEAGKAVEVSLLLTSRIGCTFPSFITFNVKSFFNLSQRIKPVILKKKKLLLKINIVSPQKRSDSMRITHEKAHAVKFELKSKRQVRKETASLSRSKDRPTWKDGSFGSYVEKTVPILKKPSRRTIQATISFQCKLQHEHSSTCVQKKIVPKICPPNLLYLDYDNAVKFDESDYDVTNPKSYLLLGTPKPKLSALPSYHQQNDENDKDLLLSLNLISPLSPTQLYNVTFLPKELEFGKVPILKECPITVKIENLNFFPISIKFWTNADLRLPKEEVIVEASSFKTTEIILTLKNVGNFFSNLGYAINGKHTFYKRVTAEGVTGILEVSPTNIHFKSLVISHFMSGLYSPVTLNNPYMVPMFFKWKIFSRALLEVIPESGIIKPKSSMTCLVYLLSNPLEHEHAELTLKVDDGTCEERIRCVIEPSIINYEVILLTKLLPLGHMAVGTSYKKKIFVFNNGYTSARYTLTCSPPTEGVKLNPKIGLIGAKSLESISISFFFDCLMLLDVYLLINIENLYSLKLHVTGRVVFPEVTFSPSVCEFINTPCNAFCTVPVKVKNLSKAEVRMQFLMDSYPQFKLSTAENYLLPGIGTDGVILLPGGYCTLYIHFTPYNIVTYEFLLPVLLNSIIGPPSAGQPESLRPQKYLRFSLNSDKRTNAPLAVPDSFSTVRINTFVLKAELEFSQLNFHFFSMEKNSRYKEELEIYNPTNTDIIIGLNTRHLSIYPFSFVPLDKKRENEKNIYTIKQKQSFLVNIFFEPTETGSWDVGIPIYKYISNAEVYLYNNIQIYGICYQSSLHCDVSEIYFPPVPLKTKTSREVVLVASYQRFDTNVHVSFGDDLKNSYPCSSRIKVTFPNSSFVQRNKSLIYIPVVISFESSNVFSSKVTIHFSDSDEGSCVIHVYASAVASLISSHSYCFLTNDYLYSREDDVSSMKISKLMAHGGKSNSSESDSIMTPDGDSGEMKMHLPNSSSSSILFGCDHPSIVSLDEISWFPEFPPSNVKSPFASYMNRIVKYVNKWLLYQALSGNFQLKVGEDMGLSDAYGKFVKTQPVRCKIITIIDLINHLFGFQIILKYKIPSMPYQGEMNRIFFSLEVFKRILQFLKDEGNYLAHIIPMYLLGYDDFVTLYNFERREHNLDFTKNCNSLLSETVYERISKQLWTDFYLQLYKTHILDHEISQKSMQVYNRGTFNITSEESIARNHSTSDISFKKLKEDSKSIKELVPDELLEQISDLYCQGEKILLAWLTMTYNKVSQTNFNMPPLENYIDNFKEALADCTVLAVVTSYYCPFLIQPCLKFIKFNPTSEAEIKHNANCLISSWDKLMLGFNIHTWDITNGDSVLMIMLVSHLFLTLPGYLPAFSLNFKIALGSALNQQLAMHNPSETDFIKCTLKLFQEEGHEVFRVVDCKEHYRLSPKSKTSITLNFYARYTHKCTGILLLRGTFDSDIQGKPTCVKLIGELDKMTMSNKFTIHIPIYRLTYVNLKIWVPFKKACKYDICASMIKPTPEKGFEKIWKINDECRIPQELYLSTNRVIIKDIDAFYLPIAACCYSTGIKDFWLLFTNKFVGEFITQISINPYTLLPTSILNVTIPINASNLNIVRTVNVSVPSMNTAMWKAASSVVNLSSNKSDSFWISYLAFPVGRKLLEYEAIHNCPSVAHFMEHFSHKTVTYNLDWTSPLIFGPAQVVIDDVHSTTPTNIKMIVDKSVNEAFSMLLSLVSEDKKEVRTYKVNFIPISVERKQNNDTE